VAEDPGWNLRVVNFLEKVLDSRDTCHHPNEGQIFTTIDAPRFPTYRSLWKRSQGSENNQHGCFRTHHGVCAVNFFGSLQIFCN